MVTVSRFNGMRFPTCDSCECRLILPIAAALIVTTGANSVTTVIPLGEFDHSTTIFSTEF